MKIYLLLNLKKIYYKRNQKYRQKQYLNVKLHLQIIKTSYWTKTACLCRKLLSKCNSTNQLRMSKQEIV